MTPPPGFSTSGPSQVCKLKKSLYGLKQAPCQGFAKLSSKLLAYGLVRSYADCCFFTYRKGDIFVALLVYVDDIILTENDSKACQDFKAYLKVAYAPKGLCLRQRKYTLKIIDECDLLVVKPVDFPVEENHRLALTEGRLLNDPSRYRRLIGRLIHLTLTCLELSYAVHVFISVYAKSSS